MPRLGKTDPRILGQRITEARKARGKTQEELADLLECSRPTYIAIEKGDRQPKSNAADAKDENDQAVVFDLADESVIAYTVFPELSKPRTVQRLSDAPRIF